MSEVRWCWTHDERIHDACPSAEWQDGMCDVRDAVVLPKGNYYTIDRDTQAESPSFGYATLLLLENGVLRKVET